MSDEITTGVDVSQPDFDSIKGQYLAFSDPVPALDPDRLNKAIASEWLVPYCTAALEFFQVDAASRDQLAMAAVLHCVYASRESSASGVSFAPRFTNALFAPKMARQSTVLFTDEMRDLYQGIVRLGGKNNVDSEESYILRAPSVGIDASGLVALREKLSIEEGNIVRLFESLGAATREESKWRGEATFEKDSYLNSHFLAKFELLADDDGMAKMNDFHSMLTSIFSPGNWINFASGDPRSAAQKSAQDKWLSYAKRFEAFYFDKSYFPAYADKSYDDRLNDRIKYQLGRAELGDYLMCYVKATRLTISQGELVAKDLDHNVITLRNFVGGKNEDTKLGTTSIYQIDFTRQRSGALTTAVEPDWQPRWAGQANDDTVWVKDRGVGDTSVRHRVG